MTEGRFLAGSYITMIVLFFFFGRLCVVYIVFGLLK